MKSMYRIEMSITSTHYSTAEKALRADCPSLAFPHIPDNCWVDSTMFGLTYSSDIGRVLRAALLGCLENLRDSNIRSVSSLYKHVKTWQLEPIWNTYITRMLLFFLFGKDAKTYLTCPLIRGWVENFRKKTLQNAEYTSTQIEKTRGGITQYAIFAILTSLSISTDIITERVAFNSNGSRKDTYFYTGDTMKFTETPPLLKGYEARIGHYTVKGEGSTGHVIVAFLCKGDLFLYDNNQFRTLFF